MNSRKILAQRTISAFPVSIGTALVLESLFTGRLPAYDPERVVPKINTNRWRYHMWSLRTLLRNLLGSVEHRHHMGLINDYAAVTTALLEEIETITDIYRVEGNGIITPIFYWNKHTDILQNPKHPLLQVRPFSKKAFGVELLSNRVFTALKGGDAAIETYDKLPVLPDGKVLITTHAIVDLLASISGTNLGLVESHTGVLKTRELWHTKLYGYNRDNKSSYSRLPLTREVLYIMGDKWVIKPHKIAIRRDLLDISRRRDFKPTTSAMRVRHWLEKDMGVKL